MRDDYAEQEHTTQRPAPHTLQDITPYLGLRARLSQVWINRWTILLLLVLVRVLIAIGSLHTDLGSAKVQALSACSSVESMGSAMASMPHYMSQGTNELAAKGVEKAVSGLESMLFMAVTALEEIFVFVINMMYGTYECLITLAVGTASHAAIALAEDVTKFLNDTIGDITKDINSATGDFNNAINRFIGTFNTILGKSKPPTIDLGGPLDKLDKLQIPTGVQDELNKLNQSIPNFAQVHNATNTVLRLPFELIKKEMREHLGNFTFNQSVFPVPARKQLTFCSDDDGISSFFDGLYHVADIARKIFIAVLLLAAVLACVPIAYLEIRRWRSMQERAALVESRSLDPMDVVYIASRPYTAGAGLKAAQNFTSTKKQILIRWFVAYCTSTPALLVLALALAGFFSCLCQYILLQAIRKEVPALVNTVGAFTGKVVDALDTASTEWSNGANAVILAENHKINDNVFGWVNTSTKAVNDTLNSFVHETTDLLNGTFGGTILYEPMKGIFDCLVGLKVEALQKGLTWAHDHAHVDFPLFPNDTFSAGASKALSSDKSKTGESNDSFVSDPGSGTTDKITSAIVGLTDKLIAGIRVEALISTVVLGIYLAVVLMALARVLVLLCRRERHRGEGGASYAGDIGSRNTEVRATINPTSSTMQHTGAAPAYEERFAAFKGPIPGITEKEQWRHDDSSRGSARQPEPVDMTGGRNESSMYGVLEDEKR